MNIERSICYPNDTLMNLESFSSINISNFFSEIIDDLVIPIEIRGDLGISISVRGSKIMRKPKIYGAT